MSHGDPHQTLVTYASLEDAAQSIQRQARRLDDDLRTIQRWVNGVSEVWEGEAKTAYDRVQHQWDQRATHLHTTLQEIANRVRTAGTDYRATDRRAAQGFGG